MTNQRDERLGKFISLVLRHKPEAAGIVLDENGWAEVSELLDGICQTGRKMDRNDLERIVQNNNKKRYMFNEGATKIRACQGHSLKVELGLEQRVPPDILYHGTATRFLDSICEKGILKMNRQYVHLSSRYETAIDVGKRHGKPVVLTIRADLMKKDGIKFYLSENGVWLCEHISWKYVET